MAQSSLFTDMVSKTVKECLGVLLEGRSEASDANAQPLSDEAKADKNELFALSAEAKAFKKELFPQQTLFMGLKLLLIIC